MQSARVAGSVTIQEIIRRSNVERDIVPDRRCPMPLTNKLIECFFDGVCR